jgi:predicted aspartyl protease
MAGAELDHLRFPSVPVRVRIGEQTLEWMILIDTGFDRDLSLPATAIPLGVQPAGIDRWHLADGSVVETPAYRASIEIAGMQALDGLVTALGDEPILGLNLIRRFAVLLDHGRRVVIEP